MKWWSCVLLRWSGSTCNINTLMLESERDTINNLWVWIDLNIWNNPFYPYIYQEWLKSFICDVVCCVDSRLIKSDGDLYTEVRYCLLMVKSMSIYYVRPFNSRFALGIFATGLANDSEHLATKPLFLYRLRVSSCWPLEWVLTRVSEESW